MRQQPSQPVGEHGFLTLKKLSEYSSCSVRWLRDRLIDQSHPLPHYRIAGKLLVKRDDFDVWIAVHRVAGTPNELEQIVQSVVRQVCLSRPA
jgi:hypothetical protein